MNETIETKFMNQIQTNEAIIHKVIGLYVDEAYEKEDLYQEILLQCWKSFNSFRGEAKFSTWLYKVSLNTIFSFNKKKKKTKKTKENIDVKEVEEKPLEEEQAILCKIIKALNPIDRMIMTLHLDGYKNKEIADIIGVNNNNLNVKIHRLKENVIATFKRIYNE